MLLNFKNKIINILVLTVLSVTAGFGQQVVYDLAPDWVYFDFHERGFLPAVMANGDKVAISFTLPEDEFDRFYLRIIVNSPAYLFHNQQLIRILEQGPTYLPVDSLKSYLSTSTPQLTIYGQDLIRGLSTEIVSSGGGFAEIPMTRPKNNAYNNYFIMVLLLFMIGLVLLQSLFSELTGQYFALTRTLDTKTMDEPIYKIRFLGVPNIYFIALMSLAISWVMVSYHQSNPAVLLPDLFDATVANFSSYMVTWLLLAGLAFLIFVIKYFLVFSMSGLFAFKTAGIHFASHLRLEFWTLLLVALLTIVDHFFIIHWLVHVLFIGTILFTILRIIFIFLRLLRLTNHTILHLLLYLCATEIIPFVFIYKLVIG
jgi:hypothetical protein